MPEKYMIKLKKLGRSPAEISADHSGKSDAEMNTIIARSLDAEPYVDYAELIRVVARNAPADGFDENEMKKAVEVIRAVEVAEMPSSIGMVFLDKDVWAWFVGRLAAFKWRVPHQHILDFCADVRCATRAPEEGKG